ncbi:MAG: potassium transporter [Alphaproteobacteria bacterium]|nr:potassium transporter [Alphaproteobacteria bacterium]
MSFATIFAAIGRGLVLLAGAMVVPAAVALGFEEYPQVLTFLVAAALTSFVGGGLAIATRGTAQDASKREGFLLAVLLWLLLPFFAALPLYFSPSFASPTDAYFEAVSGLTTTGATVLVDFASAPRSVLFWRAMVGWIGGLSTIVFALALLSLYGIGGMQLYRSAMPRGERDALMPRLVEGVRSVWKIYLGLTLACTAALWVSGMPPFEALTHAFSTLSTTGFGNHAGSVAAFANPAVEIVLIVFMLAAALNFTLHWAALHGAPGAYVRDPELRLLAVLGLAALAATYLAVGLSEPGGPWQTTLRHLLFTVVSVMTTTGFAAADASAWPLFVPAVLLALVLVGGSTGSTAGGLKLMRMLLFLKQAGRELARLPHPHGVVRIRYGERVVPDAAMVAAWSFFFFFVVALAGLAGVLALAGLEFRGALTMAAAALSNAGPVAGIIDPAGGGYAPLGAAAKWALCLAMVLGRLELLALLVLVRRSFWRR